MLLLILISSDFPEKQSLSFLLLFFNYRLSRDQSLLSTINNQQLQTHSQNNQNLLKNEKRTKTKNRAECNWFRKSTQSIMKSTTRRNLDIKFG